MKLNDWIDETVELQFVTREENGEPQKIRATRRAWATGASCSTTTRLPTGGCSSTPGTPSSGWRKYETERPIHRVA